MGRLTGLGYTKGGNNLFTPYSWTFDSLSSAGMDFGEAVADPRAGATAASAVFSGLGRITQMVSQDGTSTYGYDAKSELTSATHTFQSNESYSYDSNGNRTMTGYQTGDDNRLNNDGTYSYLYDAEGNRTRRTKTSTGEVTEYEWDYHNRLVKVTDKNSQGTITQVVEYTYDVFDRRIAKEVDTTSPFDMADAALERYVYDDIQNGLVSPDGGNVVLDFVDPDGSGAQSIALSRRYLYGEAVDQILAQEDLSKTLGDATRTLWPLVDNLGTVRDLAKQDGTIAVHYKYDSYGNLTSGDTSKTRYLFTGREFDIATDFQYNRARWYDARVGRWLSEDPLSFAAGDANVGRYVGNEVTGATDPSGLAWWNLWICDLGYSLGDAIGTGIAALTNNSYGDTIQIAALRQQRVMRNLANPNLSTNVGQLGAERLDVIHDGLSEAGDILGQEVNGGIAAVDLTLITLSVVDGGLALRGAVAGIGEFGAAASRPVAQGSTRVYRAVSDAEYQQMLRTGRFELGPNSLNGKWFADTLEGAQAHGSALYPRGGFRIIEADVPNSAPSLHQVPNLDGRGPARYLHLDDLGNVVFGPVE